jgi:hypothetical protein
MARSTRSTRPSSAGEDLKTGDVVEYAVVNEKPVRVKKKK